MSIFTKEFWTTPLVFMNTSDRAKGYMLLFAALVLFCVILGGIAAWDLIYGG